MLVPGTEPMTSARERTLAVLLLAGAAALLSFRGIYEPDLWWHLAQGRETAAGRLVRTNVFGGVHAEYPQPYTSWLWDLTAYGLARLGGTVALQASQAATLLAAFLALYAASRRRAGVAASVVAVALAVVVIEPRAMPRPHLVSLAGLAIMSWLIAVASVRRSARPLVWAVPLVALWSNLHLECVFGVALVGGFAVGEWVHGTVLSRRESRRALAVTVACVVALLANPYGPGLLQYLRENASVPSMVAIAELQPPHLPAYRAFYVYAALLIVSAGLRPRAVALWEVPVALLFAALGSRYLRLTPLLVLATAPMLARQLSAWIPRPLDSRAVVVTGLAATLVLSRIPPRAWPGELKAGGDALAPALLVSPGAIRFAEQSGLDGPAFTSLNAGGYVAWMLHPRASIFQDSRLQAWPPSWFGRILRSSSSQDDWDLLVSGVDWAFVSRPWPNQLSGVGRFPERDWALVYWDDAAEIRVRRRGRLADLAAASEYHVVRPEVDVFQLARVTVAGRSATILSEARRLSALDAGRLTPALLLCAGDDAAACAVLDRLVATYPSLVAPVAALGLPTRGE